MEAATAGAQGTPKRYGMGGFWALIATQFQGAFNDNLFQYLVQFTMLAILTLPGQEKPDEATASAVPAIATIVFSLPFLIFPGIAGALSDRLSKQRIAVYIKYWEIFIVCFGFLAFWLQLPGFLWVMLFFMATHSAFFSPAKYGILPEILPEERLSWGNGILQMMTIIAIIAGTAVAGPIYSALKERVYLATGVLLVLSCSGLIMAQFISKPPPANPRQRITYNPWLGMAEHFKIIYADSYLFYAVIGYTYFWFAGALVRSNAFVYASVTMELPEAQVSYVLASMALGIGAGAISAGYLSRGKIELGLVPIGTLGLALFSALLAIPGASFTATLVLLFGLGYFAGFFDVPLAATLQHRSPEALKGGIMASTNMLTFVGMLVAGALYWVLGEMHINTHTVFLLTALFSLVVGIFMCVKLPILPLWSLLWIFRNTLFRVHVKGLDRIPKTGGALIVANHMSYLDPGIVQSILDRPARFLVYRKFYESWWLGPIARTFGALPVAPHDGPRELIRTLRAAGEAVKNGELVCIFPEGEISRTGLMLTVRKGFEHIMKGVDAPIIPIYLDNLWGSLFSFSEGRFFRKWPKRVPYHIYATVGDPLPPTLTAPQLRDAIQELGAEAYAERPLEYPFLHRGFIKEARRRPWLHAVADMRSGALSYFKALAGSVVLARKLKAMLDDQPMVGLLVPPSVGGALANIALPMMGRVPVNLNYTSSAQTIAACAAKCNITHCITARAFLERFPVAVPGKPIYLEDIMKTVTKVDRIRGMLLGMFAPVRLLERVLGAKPGRNEHDLATVIFSSGSEGEPKGVMLTHYNILKNIGSLEQAVPHKRGDIMMGFLPFFHSFGLCCLLWAPITHGMGVAFHPSPLEAKQIGQLVKKYKAFFLVATPTFMQNFIRKCTPEDLETVTLPIVGAEKMPARIGDAYEAKFGCYPLEGYGATECSPGISANFPDYQKGIYYQKCLKKGTVGRLMPGMAARVLDPDTGELLKAGQPGLIQIKGPNIMKGYLGMPEKTAAVIQDGWYSTGDIAFVDEEGFITITDRLSRFSKIAGEMISHTTVENTLHELLGATELTLAVTGVPDPTRGERLIVLHTLEDEPLQDLLKKMEQCDLPNISRPRPSAFYRVDAIPVLGTGKLDLKGVKAMAERLDTGADV